MSIRLFVMRHAIAVERGSAGNTTDAARPLTDEGRIQARRAGEGLRCLKLDIDFIASSPYARALETAKEVAAALDFKAPIREIPELRPDEHPSAATAALKAASGASSILTVGHEPHVSRWLSYLLTGKEDVQTLFKKGAVACFNLERMPPPVGSAVLRWFMTAKQLAFIGKS